MTIVGRGDDMLISGGENVHPVQVEEMLNEHPGVADSCVVGLPDERWGELIVAYVVPAAASADLDVVALDAHCRAHPMLADYKRPRAYRLVDSLPMTATGKKMHFRVRETADRRRRRRPAGPPSLNVPAQPLAERWVNRGSVSTLSPWTGRSSTAPTGCRAPGSPRG